MPFLDDAAPARAANAAPRLRRAARPRRSSLAALALLPLACGLVAPTGRAARRSVAVKGIEVNAFDYVVSNQDPGIALPIEVDEDRPETWAVQTRVACLFFARARLSIASSARVEVTTVRVVDGPSTPLQDFSAVSRSTLTEEKS